MSSYDDRLKDYVDVKERLRLFFVQYPDGTVVTDKVKVTLEPDGVARVWVRASAYRVWDDQRPSHGWSWMELPGKTNFTRGSELENTETSAWGRAIGALGIGIDKSIASANEVANKEEPVTPASQNAKERAQLDKGTMVVAGIVASPTSEVGAMTPYDPLIGTGEIAKDFMDFLPKQSPDGMVLAFKLVSPAGGIKVIARGDLAEVLPTIHEDIIGKRVSCWGHVRDETFTPKGSKKAVTYQVLDLERIKTESGTLPMVEAPTAPLFTGPEFDPPTVVKGELV